MIDFHGSFSLNNVINFCFYVLKITRVLTTNRTNCIQITMRLSLSLKNYHTNPSLLYLVSSNDSSTRILLQSPPTLFLV